MLMLLASIGMSWVAVQGRRQREAAAAIEKLGGQVWRTQSCPACLQPLFGDDFATSVFRVDFSHVNVIDAALEHVGALSQLEVLYMDGCQVTDTGLEHIKGLNQLRALDLEGTKISDAGIQTVKGLPQLEALSLDRATVSDAGLEHLKELTQLRCLFLRGTKVTDEGVKKLQQALPNCQIIR
jgi:CMP-2-keto-3-deoxyoctulosonic acid synthetase